MMDTFDPLVARVLVARGDQLGLSGLAVPVVGGRVLQGVEASDSPELEPSAASLRARFPRAHFPPERHFGRG